MSVTPFGPLPAADLGSTEDRLTVVLERYVRWLDIHGEFSQDHQDFYNSELGRRAKRLYYDRRFVGTAAVLPMVIAEALFPSSRRWFYPTMRHPIADAHFAMGFAAMSELTGNRHYLDRAIHFLNVLEDTRAPGYARHGWGYPFDWETRNGVIPAGTPLITTLPYCYEAFAAVANLDTDARWRNTLRSIAEHARLDYRDLETAPDAATCTYTPLGEPRVVNASAYRAFLLTSAWRKFGDARYFEIAERNLNFVLQCQQPDGSWPYAVDGIRTFVDHFHTCFVLKALVKIDDLWGEGYCRPAIDRGVQFYTTRLFNADGLPVPFAKAPRLTVYRHELYDFAECINLGVLLRGRFRRLDDLVDRTVADVLTRWLQPSGSFRSRRLLLGWDNEPMFRWGHAAMMRSLALYRKMLAAQVAGTGSENLAGEARDAS